MLLTHFPNKVILSSKKKRSMEIAVYDPHGAEPKPIEVTMSIESVLVSHAIRLNGNTKPLRHTHRLWRLWKRQALLVGHLMNGAWR